MSIFLKNLVLTSAAISALSLSAEAQNTQAYAGNGGTNFGGPAGNGSLTFSDDGTTLTGTITPGPNNGVGATGEFYDETAIYFDTGAGGVANTSTLSAAPVSAGVPDILQQAAAGIQSTGTGTGAGGALLKSQVDFAPGFLADYVLALSPANVGFGYLYSINSDGTLTGLEQLNFLASQTSNGNGPKTFSLSLANIGSPTGTFLFATTYLNSHETVTAGVENNNLYRSDEAFGNAVTDVSNPPDTAAPGNDEFLLGENTYILSTAVIPEPSTWVMMAGGLLALAVCGRRHLSRV